MDRKDKVIVALSALLLSSAIISGIGFYISTRPSPPVPPPDPCAYGRSTLIMPPDGRFFGISVSTNDPNVLLYPEQQEATIYPFVSSVGLVVSVRNQWMCPATAQFFINVNNLPDVEVKIAVTSNEGGVHVIVTTTTSLWLPLNPGKSAVLNFLVEQTPTWPVPLSYPSGYIRPIASFGTAYNGWTLSSGVPEGTPIPES